MWEELGISGGTALIILIALYFVIKWAVKNGINESVLNNSSSADSILNLLNNSLKKE